MTIKLNGKVNNLGERIRLLRLKNQWTQESVANRLFISIPAYSKIETGITDLNLSRLEQIAKIFNLPLTELLNLDKVRENEANDTALQELNLLLKERNQEVINLHKKIIDLYEELGRIQGSDKS
ncbi:helix-turn-helix domain-containing protein [Desertivirga brevis]|uniref:helix-turn-helix domain-containing protein n=1 Tax=Desertivirga brevis TaxID=2810310 RepID=UPI001F606DC5|nr:helix-turn-helix transcriptional regulator [Pedobacter sp. SYSU D00873]